jgi:hypothetical protein
MGGIIAQTRAVQMQNQKLSLLFFDVVVANPKERSLNAKSSPSTRSIP